ncbi:dipeptidase [Thermomonas carbonis]|uniref:Membrane dipeptidase n=1 Tax=Thermomonas carbonis TaxID=1463158 RepID=A0A7G9SM79_9GAMM|nr:membrane dipeptidase [Thermomonas carbonis]QNN68954.1 membrane dipeptidase [Thermomonas carbonis]GHC07708.1 dipeptidase [Thermomonas carbonis]
MRHAALAASILASLALAAPIAQAQDAAAKLAQDAIIVDTHIDAPGILMDTWADLGVEAKDREFDYPRSRAGGLDVAFMSIYTSPKQDADGSAWHVANQMIDGVEALVHRHPGKFAILTSPRDVSRLLEGGRVLLPLGMENGAPLGDHLANVKFFFDRGVRYITLAHSANNRLADSSYALEKTWNGLSPFGRDVVREMNRVGIMVDVSHLGDASAMEAIKLSRVPVIASHSAFRHFTPDFERNISDAVAKAVAAKGGVIQVPFGTAFIDPASAADTQAYFRAIDAFDRGNAALKAQGQPPKDRAAFGKDWDAAHPARASTLAQVLDQIDYGVKLLGIDHVGIGSDFDGVDGELPPELKTVADFPHLVAGLQARGYKDADIRKILGGNLLRAWTAIEAGAGK